MKSRIPRYTVIAAAWLASFGLIAAAVPILREFYRLETTPWYRVTIEGSGGRTLVRFAQPEARLVSPDFFVAGAPSATGTFMVGPGRVMIPGCEHEFWDHSPMGGRQKLRIGGVLFDLMEARVIVDGVDHGWRRGPG